MPKPIRIKSAYIPSAVWQHYRHIAKSDYDKTDYKRSEQWRLFVHADRCPRIQPETSSPCQCRPQIFHVVRRKEGKG